MNQNDVANSGALTVVIADDDESVRDVLSDLVRSQPGMEVVASAADHPSTIAAVLGRKPDVVLLDVVMPEGSATETVRAIRSQVPRTRILSLAEKEDVKIVLDVLAAGAQGYLVKNSPRGEIVEAIHRAVRSQLSAPADLLSKSIRRLFRQLRDHHRSEELLKLGTQHFHAVFHHIGTSILLIDRQYKIELVNDQVSHMFGYAPSELVGLPVTALLPERYQAAGMADSLAAGEQTLPARRKDGSEFSAVFLLSEDPEAHAHVLSVRDTSDLVWAQTRYLRLAEAFPEPLLVIDQHERITVVSEKAERVFGWKREQLVGSQLDRLLVNYPRGLLQQPEPAPGPMSETTFDLLGRHKDGRSIPLTGTLRSLDGEYWLAIAASGKQGEDDHPETSTIIEASDRQLRQLVAKSIRERGEERRRIASDIQRDALQVVTAVALRVQQLRNRITDPKDLDVVRRLDETVHVALDRLRQVVSDAEPAEFSHSLIEPLRSDLERLRDQRGIEFTLDDRLRQALPSTVRALAYEIAQQIIASISSKKSVTLITVAAASDSDGVRVRITDNGEVFDAHTPEGTSWYLGLEAVSKQAALAGGWARIDSAQGRDTVVEFWLPSGEADP